MANAKFLTLGMLAFVLSVGAHPAYAQTTAKEWTHESDELPDGSLPTDLKDNSPPWQVGSSWDSFIDQLPNSKFIKWSLSWVGVSAYERNSSVTHPMSPASVQKILTSTTALRVLGPEFRFANSFQARVDSAQALASEPEFSISGDPTWGHSAYGETLFTRMQKVTAELVKQGVKKVSGEIKVTLTQPKLAEHIRPEQWKQSWLLECYASLPGPVMLNGNCATFKVSAVNKASWTTAGVSTPLDVKLTKARSTSLEIAPVLDDFGRVAKYEIRGTFASANSYTVPVQNNIEWLKNLFVLSLQQAGIAYEAHPAQPLPLRDEATAVYVDLSSKTLREILSPFLEESINLIGDRLYLEVAYHLGSVKMNEGTLRSLVEVTGDASVADQVTVIDGSGLIAADQISAQNLRFYLMGLRNQTYFLDFLHALPKAGMTGTLAGRLGGPLTKGKIFAKTGTIDGVANLAGYYLKSDSTYEPFVFLTKSNLAASTVRAQMDKIVTEFARQNSH